MTHEQGKTRWNVDLKQVIISKRKLRLILFELTIAIGSSVNCRKVRSADKGKRANWHSNREQKWHKRNYHTRSVR